jgi:hypothetical protein
MHYGWYRSIIPQQECSPAFPGRVMFWVVFFSLVIWKHVSRKRGTTTFTFSVILAQRVIIVQSGTELVGYGTGGSLLYANTVKTRLVPVALVLRDVWSTRPSTRNLMCIQGSLKKTHQDQAVEENCNTEFHWGLPISSKEKIQILQRIQSSFEVALT